MPRVPTYEGQQVATAPLPAVRLSDAPSQAPIETGRALRSVSGAVQQVALQEKQRADETALFEFREEFNRWEQDRIFNPKGGAFYKKGRDAFDLPDVLPTDFDTFAGEMEKRAANDTQRRGLAQMRASRKEQLGDWLNRHVGRERETYYEQRYLADVESSKERAANHPDRSDIIETEVAVQRARTFNYLRDKGASEEVIAQELQKHETDTHARVLDRFLANEQDQAASAHYARVKDRMDPDVRTKVEKALADSSLRGESQRIVRDLMGKYETIEGALAEIDKIEDPKKQDAVRQRFKQAWSDKRAAEEDYRNDVFRTAAGMLEAVGGDFDKVKGALGRGWYDLDSQQRRELEARTRQIREGIEPVTDWTLYYDLKTLASSDATREAFLSQNLLTHRSRLADVEFKELTGIQEALRSGRRSTDADGFLTTKQIVDDNLSAAGIDPTPKPNSEAAKQVAQFRRVVDEQIVAYKAAYGKDMPNKEKQQLVDNLLVKDTVPGSGIFGFFPSERRVFEAGKDERGIAIKPVDIPRAERTKIEAALRRANRPVTDEAVVELYNRKLQRVLNAAE